MIEVFLEQNWNDAVEARQKRDERMSELTAQGMNCTAELLYNAVTGKRIYTINATIPDQSDSDRSTSTQSATSKRPYRRKR